MLRTTRQSLSTTAKQLFVRRLSLAALRQLIALVLVIALLAPTAVFANGRTNDSANSAFAQIASVISFGWSKLAALSGFGQDHRGKPMPSPEGPLPPMTPAKRPHTKAEHEARVVKLELNPQGEVQLEQQRHLLFAAIPVDVDGSAIHGLISEWESSDAEVVSITSDGQATAGKLGTAQLTAKAGNKQATVKVTVIERTVMPGESQDNSTRSTAKASQNTKHARFINALWTPDEESQTTTSARRTYNTKFIKAAMLADLPSAQNPSLSDPGNAVGSPSGYTEPGAATPPAAVSGTERPYSGNYTFNVPIVDLPGRGIDAALALVYNSRVWHKSIDSAGSPHLTYDVDSGWPGPGFTMNYGSLQWTSNSSYNYCLRDADGTRHKLVLIDAATNLYGTTDGTFITFTGSSEGSQATYPDGTRIIYGSGMYTSYPTKIYDSNGNYILISYVNGSGPRISSIQDTMGRYVRFYYDSSNNLVAITRPDYAGTVDRMVVRFYYQDIAINPSFQVATTAPTTARVLKYVFFYRDGTHVGYRFDYSSYGMIYQIAQLRDMAASYYQLDQTGTITSEGQTAATTTYNYPTGPSNLPDAPQYTQRTDDWAGRTSSQPTYTFAVDQVQGTSTITAPDGTVTQTTKIVNPGQWNDGLVSGTTVRQGATLLGSTTTTWQLDGINPRPQQIAVTNDANQTRSVVYTYGSYNNVAVASERDFNGVEARRTEVAYETRSQYTSRGLLHLPTSVKIYKGGATTPDARVNYVYDTAGTNLTARSDVIMHSRAYDPYAPVDPTYNAVNYDPATDNRGNVTSVTRYVDAAGGTSPITNTQSYDITGNVLTATVDCCQQKTYTYTNAFQYAYPITETSGNAGQLTTSANYDFNTGLVRSRTDENNQQTSIFWYGDTLRLYTVQGPDGSYTRNTYADKLYADPDAAHMHSYVASSSTLDNQNYGRTVETYTYVDGRGAVARTFGHNTANGYEEAIDINYDVMGRPYQTSNPYYSSGTGSPINPTGLWTTSAYDALWRVNSVTLPDGNVSRVSYAGSMMTTTDTAGRQRRASTDSLGRMQWVDEPDATGNMGAPSAPMQRSYYSYNALGNLVQITQGAQNRYFKYDGLGRMTYERDPEQDAPYYAPDSYTGNNYWSSQTVYDSQSRVNDSYDARQINTHFSYDGLNRVTQATYSDGTPAATYTYDQAHPGYYNSGRLTQIATAAVGSTPATSQAFDHNLMGRVVNQTESIGSSTYQMSYSYDLGGRLTSETYPSGRVVKDAYDEAARLQSVTDATNQTYDSGFTYDPRRAVTAENFGNGATRTVNYNNRLQTSQVKLMAGGVEQQRYDYWYGQIDQASGNVDQTKNTGQVGRMDASIGGVKQWDQRYTYDSLGRLSQDGEYQSGTSMTYQAHYDYDRYNNRYQYQGNINVPYKPVQTTEIDQTRNRFTSGVAYDPAGNEMVDNKFRGMQYQYDANNRTKWAALSDGTGATTGVYDGTGGRVMTTATGGVWRHMVRDIYGRIIVEYGQNGWERDNIYRGQEVVAMQDGRQGLMYTMADGQGSTRVVMNSGGQVMARHDFMPYGEDIQAGTGMRTGSQGYGAVDNMRQRYDGMEQDDGTGMSHTEWRKLENMAGRWTSTDPTDSSYDLSEPQSFNRYSYVQNDPVNMVDPSGLDGFQITYGYPFPGGSRRGGGSRSGGLGGFIGGLLGSIFGGGSGSGIYPITYNIGPPTFILPFVTPGFSGTPMPGVVAPPNTTPLPAKEGAAASNALAALIKALSGKISKNCQKNVVDKLANRLGFNLADFVSYLGKGANFYNGLTSQAPIAGTLTSPQAANAGYGNGATIAGVFNDTSNGLQTNALTSTTSSTLLVFFRPNAISTSGGGVNSANLGLLFHEGLHGYGGTKGATSYFDQDLKSTFGLKGSGSGSISNYISRNCF